MEDKDMLEAAKRFIDAGVQLNAVYEPIGCMFSLRPSDVLPFLKDRDAFFAEECALGKEEYQAWKAFTAGGRLCTHKGKRGPCSRAVQDSHGISPQEFARRRAEGDLLCSRHRAEAGRERTRQ